MHDKDPMEIWGALFLHNFFFSSEPVLWIPATSASLNSDLCPQLSKTAMDLLGSTPCATVWKIPPGIKGESSQRAQPLRVPSLSDYNLGLPVNEKLWNLVLYILLHFLVNRVKRSTHTLIWHGWKWNKNCIMLFYIRMAFLYHILVLFKYFFKNYLLLFLMVIYFSF